MTYFDFLHQQDPLVSNDISTNLRKNSERHLLSVIFSVFLVLFLLCLKDMEASGPTLCSEVEVMRQRQIVISYVSQHCNTLNTAPSGIRVKYLGRWGYGRGGSIGWRQ